MTRFVVWVTIGASSRAEEFAVAANGMGWIDIASADLARAIHLSGCHDLYVLLVPIMPPDLSYGLER